MCNKRNCCDEFVRCCGCERENRCKCRDRCGCHDRNRGCGICSIFKCLCNLCGRNRRCGC